jgi:excisionase family DNA binding protein
MKAIYRELDDLPLSMRIEDVMTVLDIGRNTAYELVRSGKIRSIRIGRQLRISKDALEAFLRGVEVSS